VRVSKANVKKQIEFNGEGEGQLERNYWMDIGECLNSIRTILILMYAELDEKEGFQEDEDKKFVVQVKKGKLLFETQFVGRSGSRKKSAGNSHSSRLGGDAGADCEIPMSQDMERAQTGEICCILWACSSISFVLGRCGCFCAWVV
jgi:hypothetical protein